jgi:hypothetical protein
VLIGSSSRRAARRSARGLIRSALVTSAASQAASSSGSIPAGAFSAACTITIACSWDNRPCASAARTWE